MPTVEEDASHWNQNGELFVKQAHDTYPFISNYNLDTLSGKSALITGSSRGIGLQTAVHFAKAGCSKIALAARSSLHECKLAVEKAAAEAGSEVTVITLSLDVSSPEQVQAAAATVKETFGTLDILINNAGYMSEFHHIGDTDPSTYLKNWRVSMDGAYLCSRYFLPLLMESTLKIVINVSSIGSQVRTPGASGYQTAKFAMCRFTEFLDTEYGDQGLVAIVIHPGGVKTDLALSMPDYMMDYLVHPPELPADAMVWLCRERRSWLSGRFVSVTWDMEQLEGRKDEIVQKDLLKFRMAFN